MAAAKKVAAKKAVGRKAVAALPAPPVKQLVVAALLEREKRQRRVVGEPKPAAAPTVSYFASQGEKTGLRFVSSGCALLDQALGGGWPLGRTANIVGDKSSGKTLMAMELCTNFHLQYPNGWIRYAEAEAAFEEAYAEEMGTPVHAIEFNPRHQYIGTVEQLFADMERCIEKYKERTEGLYIVDSLDALSDEAELDAEFDKGSFGGAKPKAIGKMFRMLITKMEERGILFVVVSQVRDKIGAIFGPTKTRSGGKALDFYATQIVWLSEIGKIERTMAGIKRPVGINVEAYVRKNKVGLPYRKARYPVLYGYGIDDMTASVQWLVDNKRADLLKSVGMSQTGYDVLLRSLRDKGGQEARDMRATLCEVVAREWAEIETGFLPKARKY